MRASWLGGRQESLGRRLALLPLLPAAWVYGAGARLHRGLYRSGLLRKERLSYRVVSVGNLLVGGTGKTPAAAWIATQLQRRGHKVVLASRGYGRRGPGRGRVLVVSDGRFVHGRAETAGDEPMVLAAHAPGVPVLVGRDRTLLGWRALSAFGAEVLVLDDGFQHHRLHRDVDVVVFDGALGFGNRHYLPRGPLREPPRVLHGAQAVGVVDGPLAEPDAALLARHAPDAFVFAARRRPAALRPLAGGERQDPALLRGRQLGMLCGLARPASLRATLEALGGGAQLPRPPSLPARGPGGPGRRGAALDHHGEGRGQDHPPVGRRRRSSRALGRVRGGRGRRLARLARGLPALSRAAQTVAEPVHCQAAALAWQMGEQGAAQRLLPSGVS